MRLPIDTTDLTLIAGSVEPVTDFETKQPKADANGELLYALDIVAFGAEGGPQVWPVKVAGEPKGITTGANVTVTDLVAAPWTIDGRHGISFRAGKVVAEAKPSTSKAAA